MKISIPIEIKKEGGVYTFLNQFIDYLAQKDIPYSNKIDGDEDILFTNSWILPHNFIYKAKNKNKKLKVVHRIDGSGKDYGRTGNADDIQSKINKLADLTVFQSHYGKYATREKYHIIKNDGPVIYNPVDIDLFSPDGEKIEYSYKIKICCATFSTNPKKGKDIIYDLAATNKDYDFILCGRYDDAPLKNNIHPLGILNKRHLASVFRSCDLFVFPSQNETCPNVVLEAMSSGLPIVYHPSGGTHEIVNNCGLPLQSNFREIVSIILNKKKEFSAQARNRCIKEFQRDKIFDQYVEAMSLSERKADQKSMIHILLDKCRRQII
ncbi:glycosyltransferase [Candidatus Parcubacteria bacterium]|nr:MAG: glycosyltransferase [Candidatus Parcubacteria bacterium]